MRLLASHLVNPLIVPLGKHRTILVNVKWDMKTNPRLDPDKKFALTIL